MSQKSWHASVREPISNLYCDITPIISAAQGKAKSSTVVVGTDFIEQLLSGIVVPISEKPKLTINIDDLLVRQSIAAIVSELYMKDNATDTPKSSFLQIKS